MGNCERRKGRDAEQEVARIFRAHGFEVQRTPNSGGLHVKGDVTGVPGFHIEVKRQETLRLPLWIRQAEADCGELLPLVIYRRNYEQWMVVERDRPVGYRASYLYAWLKRLQTRAMRAAPEREAAP